MSEDTYRGETKEPDTQHLYVYCSNNPINYVDPSGHTKYKVTGFPPANQTKYKRWRKITIKIDKMNKIGKKLQAIGGDAGQLVLLGSVAALKYPLAYAIVATAGGAIYWSGRYVSRSVKEFKKLCKFKMTTYFKWKNSKKNDYR